MAHPPAPQRTGQDRPRSGPGYLGGIGPAI